MKNNYKTEGQKKKRETAQIETNEVGSANTKMDRIQLLHIQIVKTEREMNNEQKTNSNNLFSINKHDQ